MDVVIVGAGPTGLTLAYELGLAGVDAVVVEQLPERVVQTKGGALQARSAELLDLRGLLEPMVERAPLRKTRGGHFGLLPVPLDARPWRTRHPDPIAVPQWMIEEELEKAAAVPVLRDHEVTAVTQDEDGVVVTTSGGSFRAKYVVAADGAHSRIRKLLEMPFPGRSGTARAVLADVRLASMSELVPRESRHISELQRTGEHYWGMLLPVDGTRYRFTFGREGETAPEEIQAALADVYGEETRLGEVYTLSQFGDATRQLESYRKQRVLFSGDAAHIHPPYGGQGLNLGLQDAMNLGWKLAAKLRGEVDLLDTYQDERHPPAARVVHHTAAQRVFAHPDTDPDIAALRDIFVDLLRLPDTNRYLAGMMSGLDLPGRVEDLDLVTADGPTRLSRLMRSGRGLLLDFGDGDWPTGWSDRVDVVHAKTGTDRQPILLRPDGVCCWSGERPVTAALTEWFGHATG
jgi:2-polyprenyl-6-methoxyphenol hydroxylase-like FAD-dependent oxidoreductase